jgi:hypothetical protein
LDVGADITEMREAAAGAFGMEAILQLAFDFGGYALFDIAILDGGGESGQTACPSVLQFERESHRASPYGACGPP